MHPGSSFPHFFQYLFFFFLFPLTFHKLAYILHSVKRILDRIHIFQAQHNDHNHSHECILVCKHHLDVVHSLDYMNKHLVLCNFHFHMMDYKRVYKFYQFYQVEILVCKHMHFHYTRRYHKLRLNKIENKHLNQIKFRFVHNDICFFFYVKIEKA